MAYTSTNNIVDERYQFRQDGPTISKLVRPSGNIYNVDQQTPNHSFTSPRQSEDRFTSDSRRTVDSAYESMRRSTTDNQQEADRRNQTSAYTRRVPTADVFIDPKRRPPAQGNARTCVMEINIAVTFGPDRVPQVSFASNDGTFTTSAPRSTATIDDVRYIDLSFQAPEKTAQLSTDGIIRRSPSQKSAESSSSKNKRNERERENTSIPLEEVFRSFFTPVNYLAYLSMQQTNSQKDTTFTKIFVGGLPYHTTDETLRAFFSKFGEIDEAVVITDRSTGKSRGYGFVTMGRKEGADEAVKEPNPTIDGRRANVNLAYLGAKSRTATLPLSYSVLARMPTYQSAATAYPSNLVYYPLAQQSGLQQPVYLTSPAAAGGTTWPTNLFSQFNLANLSGATTSNSNVSNTGTSSPQTVYEISPALFDSSSSVVGQQLFWPNHN